MRRRKRDRPKRIFLALTARGNIAFQLIIYILIFVIIAFLAPQIDYRIVPMAFAPNLTLFSDLERINLALLGTQATLVALTLPIALALVSLLSQRLESEFTPFVTIYYRESFAFELASSSLSLLIVLVFHLFSPVTDAIRVHSPHQGADIRATLSVFHISWFIVNILISWHFIRTTLQFVNPDGRSEVLKSYTANVATKRYLKNVILRAILNAPQEFNLLETRDVLAFGPFWINVGKRACVKHKKGTFRLYDVKFALLAIVRWFWQRAARKRRPQSTGPSLMVFPVSFDQIYQDEIVLCRVQNGPEPGRIERFLITQAFWFKRE